MSMVGNKRARISSGDRTSDDTGGDAGNGGHEETQLDPISRGWKIQRGIPSYTHARLPFVWEFRVAEGVTYAADYGFRMTSPYDPIIGSTETDINPGTGYTPAAALQAEGVDARGDAAKYVAFWDYFSGMYKYYSTLSCRYKMTIENTGHDKMFAHEMFVTKTTPPVSASNFDMMIWKGVKSHLLHPHSRFTEPSNESNNTYDSIGTFDVNIADTNINNQATSTPVVNKIGNPIAYITGEYRPGQTDHEVIEDEDVSIFTPVTQNPSLREALLVRIRPYNNASVPAAGSTDNQTRNLSLIIHFECEYLVEFKELTDNLRWPVSRNPVRIETTSNPTFIGTTVT